MMAALFVGISLVMLMILFNKERAAFVFLALSVFFSILMLWHHATDTLQINW